VRDDVKDLIAGQLHRVMAFQIGDFDFGFFVVLLALAVRAVAEGAALW
jgi:hypothetical protein